MRTKSGHLILGEKMKKIHQEPISIENQVKNLIDLGLLVEDKSGLLFIRILITMR
jgi:hypothetical protein